VPTLDVLTRVSQNAAPCLDPLDFESVSAALAEGVLGRGTQSERFEAELSDYLDGAAVVTVASGTTALHLALIAAGVEPGGDVCVPSFTFCASVQAILAAGANPVFVDNAPGSLAFDVDDLLHSVTPRTRAVMPVHYSGRHVNLDAIDDELARRGVAVVEDAAHAFGSVRADGTPFTGRNSWVCFSFDAIKNITCAEGGAIIPPRATSDDVPRLLRALGMDRASRIRQGDYVVTMPGFRAHLAEMNAALGRSQLARMDTIAKGRRQVWRTYAEHVDDIWGATIFDVDLDHTVPFNCAITVDPLVRDDLVDALRGRGVGVGRHYPANHLQPAFQAYATRPLPYAEWASSAVVTLPFGPDLTTRHVAVVCAALDEELSRLS
jgi:dTDP-4-amino-4,6-dideoxygalactose transaminase